METTTAATQVRRHSAPMALLALLATLLCVLMLAQPARAGSLQIGADGSSATIAAPLSVKYKASEMRDALWNHGSFYIYFFQGASGVETELVKRRGSDIKTSQVSLKFSEDVSWAKVHVASVDSSTPGNGGKNKRLKDSQGNNLLLSPWLTSGKRFYVWISDTGGNGGAISLRGTQTRTVYANGSTFKNVETITVVSQPGANHLTQGETESDFDSVLNIPFRWEGKKASQVPFRAFNSRGVGNNDAYVTFYRMAWKQYTSGTTYGGYTPYKLQHGTTNANNLWTSVNLASIGMVTARSYTDETYQVETGDVFRNTDTSLVCCLRTPKEQLKLDTNGGTLVKGKTSYSGSAVNYKKAYCESTVTLPTQGSKKGRDGSLEGYELAGYSWKSGTKRNSFQAGSPSGTASFKSFDQASPEAPAIQDPKVTLCNSWQMPSFGPENLEENGTATLKAPSVATVTYRAQWKALPFTIHYIVNGSEVDSETVPYDESYSLKPAPSGSGGWTVRKQDGSPATASGYMPAQDLFAVAETPAENTVRYYVDDKLVASYSIPFGSEPLVTSYTDRSAPGIEFSDDGIWQTETCSFSATYKEHYNVPIQVPCTHYVPQTQWVEGYWVTIPRTVTVNGKPVTQYIKYYVSGYYVDTSYYEHDYDMQDDYINYNVCTYSSSFDVPSNPHGGTWHGWFADRACTVPAQSSYSFTTGSSLSFYSYTTHKAAFIVNGKPQLEQEKRYGEVINPYLHGDELNPFGGNLVCWFSDEACTAPWGTAVKVGADDVFFYAHTMHTIHFWMDAGKKVPTGGDQQEPGDEDEEADSGLTDDDPEELMYCRYETTLRYGETLALPGGPEVSARVTRPGCEDWAASNGRWYVDPACTVPATGGACTADATYYSFNTVKLSYALSTYAEQLQEAHELKDASTRNPVSLSSYLPAPATYRYGEEVEPKGDGRVFWSTDGKLTRSAESVRGAFLNKGASGKAAKKLVLDRSLTAYKDWAQGLFDGIITN